MRHMQQTQRDSKSLFKRLGGRGRMCSARVKPKICIAKSKGAAFYVENPEAVVRRDEAAVCFKIVHKRTLSHNAWPTRDSLNLILQAAMHSGSGLNLRLSHGRKRASMAGMRIALRCGAITGLRQSSAYILYFS